MPAEKPEVRIRMYRQGLGDCFLVTFFPEEKAKRVHMLVDCGTLGATNGVPMKDVIEDIRETTERHIHILVVTHEHEDHVSGFMTKSDDHKKVFDEFTIDYVWLAWTEDKANLASLELKDDHAELRDALMMSVHTLWNNTSRNETEKQALIESASSIRELLNFNGALLTEPGKIGFAETVDEAMDYASGLAKKARRYLFPGEVIEDKNLIEGWRFFVLGPPQNKKLINRKEDNRDSLFGLNDHLAADLTANARFFRSDLPAGDFRTKLDLEARQQFDAATPFDPIFRIEKGSDRTAEQETGKEQDPCKDDSKPQPYECLARQYYSEDWRCIDYDWLASAEDFALQLDNGINNTSLVLAFERISDGRVLLFPGDAQLGNWQSWDGSLIGTNLEEFAVKEFKTKEGSIVKNQDNTTLTPADLLKRTVFYKVGHHASHNATTRKGLGAMLSKDLVAMVSLDSQVAANRHPGWNFPNPALYKELLQVTKGSIIRSDVGWPDPTEETQKGGRWDQPSWEAIKAIMSNGPEQGHLLQNTKEVQRKNGPDATKTYIYRVYENPSKTYKIEELQGYLSPDNDRKEAKTYIDYFLY
jgi:hypothetical protein